MGEGGPRPEKGQNWREQRVQFDRRGALDTMEPRWQSDMYGSRNPVAMLLGTGGWGMFVATPWGQVDLRDANRGVFLPFKPTGKESAPQTERNQQQALGKGIPPIDQIVPGLYDFFVFDARDPAGALKDFSAITGPAVMPPKWALGYMQSHRTLEDDKQMLGIVDTFRSKRSRSTRSSILAPASRRAAGTPVSRRSTSTPTWSSATRRRFLADMHARHVKVVVHMVPWDRDKLPTLHGTIPAKAGEDVDASHIQSYWQQHVPLVTSGIDAFWPDEGDWFNLFERIKRHQLYYQGHLSTQPERPSVEPAAQWLSGHRAVGRMGLVGRHGVVVEDARGADRGRHQLLAQHRPVLGLGHRRLLSRTTN